MAAPYAAVATESRMTDPSRNGALALGAGRQFVGPSAGSTALPANVLTTALCLSLWVAIGSFALAILDGLGAHPARGLIVGLFIVGCCCVSLWQRGLIAQWLRRRPWLVVPLGTLELAAASVVGLIGGPFVAFTLTSVGIGVVVARARTVWITALVLDASYLSLLLVGGHSLASLDAHGQLGGVIGALVTYPFAAALLLGLRRLFTTFDATADAVIEGMRAGVVALPPAMAEAVALPQPAIAGLLPAPSRLATLTPAERHVVAELAGGRAPKQIALEFGVSLATVRVHIKRAKRKTGARTLPELVALAAQEHPATARDGS